MERFYNKDKDNSYPEDNDPVNHPSHYTQGGIEAIDYMKDSMGLEHFIAGCEFVIKKYLHRWRSKGGVQDLEKAQWYLTRMIEAQKEFEVGKVAGKDPKDQGQDYYHGLMKPKTGAKSVNWSETGNPDFIRVGGNPEDSIKWEKSDTKW